VSTDRTSNLAASRRELLRRRITAENLTERSTPGPAPVPVPERQELPLSPGQLRMWSLQQLDPRNVGYNITIALDVRRGSTPTRSAEPSTPSSRGTTCCGPPTG
jgi:hypothetical protein